MVTLYHMMHIGSKLKLKLLMCMDSDYPLSASELVSKPEDSMSEKLLPSSKRSWMIFTRG